MLVHCNALNVKNDHWMFKSLVTGWCIWGMHKLPLSFLDFLGPRLWKCFSFCLWEPDTQAGFLGKWTTFRNFTCRSKDRASKWLNSVAWYTKIPISEEEHLIYFLTDLSNIFSRIGSIVNVLPKGGIDSNPKWLLTVYLNFSEKLSDILIVLNSKETVSLYIWPVAWHDMISFKWYLKKW